MISLPLFLALAFPQELGSLEAARKTQAQRTAVIAKAMPSVCSVMALNSPGGGSGVIIDPRGFVVSNFHVVQKRGKKKKPRLEGQPKPKSTKFNPANKVMKIGLPDGKLYLADVLGIDPGSDLAILLLRDGRDGKKTFPYSPLGDSDKLLVGETVFAMGNPFLLATDFKPTLTWGIVSGTHRYQPGAGNRMLVYPDCIQVDAPVNPGNSGGPLFNENGEVVGINGRITIRDRGRVNTGVGFAIASNQIRNFLGDMMAGRHAEHGTLDLNGWYMKSPGESEAKVIVQSTFADSRASKLGLTIGDQLTWFNNDKVTSANQLATLVGVLPADSWITLGFRPHKENGGFADERRITFRLAKLDTGSSRNDGDPRLAPEKERRVAAVALSRNVGKGEEKVDGATMTFTGPGDEKITVQRLGQKLRWSNGQITLVRTGIRQGFKIFKGKAVKVTKEEQSKLEREFLLNCFLWRGEDRRNRLKEATVEGGVLALGYPAIRFRVPGPSEFEMFFFQDGSPAGYRYRDQLRKQLVDVMVHGEDVWFVADKKTLTNGWKAKVSYDPLPKPEIFARPSQ
jgi:S1-C subfamily serine protease